MAVVVNPAARVAVLTRRGKVYQAEAAFESNDTFYIGRKSLKGARAGELVVLRTDGRGRGEVVRRIGSQDSLAAVMEAVLIHFGVPRGFSREAEAEAARQAGMAYMDDSQRHDLTGLFTFTIDPDEAQDFDDAISLVDGPGDGESTLYVHIADVSYFVPYGSILDREAEEKANSVYLPVAVEPMLPPVLSSDACSLKPGVERKCVTVEMVFARPAAGSGSGGGGDDGDDDGMPAALEPSRTRFYRSAIRSRRRLTYNLVDDLFEGRGELEAELAGTLDRCRLLADALRAARHRRGALNIHTFEPEFRLDDEGGVTGVRPRPHSESHALIEEFMIAANEAVARFLETRGSECLYRVHEEPDPAAVDSLFDLLDDLGVPVPEFSLKKGTAQRAGQAVRELIRKLPAALSEQQRDSEVFGEIVLRSLKQARYHEANLGHFGLASRAYLHFTSPIRRYPDLVAHRALLNELHLQDWKPSRFDLVAAAEHSSENERRAAAAEHLGDDIVLARLLDQRLYHEGWDRRFEGEVISLIPSGLFVRFEECYEGYVHVSNLRGDYYAINEKGSALVGRRSGRPYRLGDRMTIRVVNIDKLRGKVELEPAR
ncbi:MAG: RNB domain-containing ribonuclease [Gaiellales bacterium]|nr:MAG: RNB domain-containing ribonuclease [Gaiellales bacterium]